MGVADMETILPCTFPEVQSTTGKQRDIPSTGCPGDTPSAEEGGVTLSVSKVGGRGTSEACDMEVWCFSAAILL